MCPNISVEGRTIASGHCSVRRAHCTPVWVGRFGAPILISLSTANGTVFPPWAVREEEKRQRRVRIVPQADWGRGGTQLAACGGPEQRRHATCPGRKHRARWAGGRRKQRPSSGQPAAYGPHRCGQRRAPLCGKARPDPNRRVASSIVAHRYVIVPSLAQPCWPGTRTRDRSFWLGIRKNHLCPEGDRRLVLSDWIFAGPSAS